jgi:hypothetical protein
MNSAMNTTAFDPTGFCMDFESGQLSHEEVVEGFQQLIDSGLAWQLQGAYGKTATDLIDSGYCTRPVKGNRAAPVVGEVRRSDPSKQGTLPNIGPYTFVSADTVRAVDHQTFRVLVYGAYNAYGLIGSECNGVAVLCEDPASVVADEIGRESSGYFGPSKAQLALFEKLRTCSSAEFRQLVNSANNLRYPI